MICRVRKAVALAVLACGLSVLTTQDTRADDRFALVKIVNKTNVPLNFSYRVGDGPWHPVQLLPGHWQGVWVKLMRPNSRRHKTIRVRFDEDLSSQRYFRTFRLKAYGSPDIDWSRARPYHFAYDGATRRFVALYKSH